MSSIGNMVKQAENEEFLVKHIELYQRDLEQSRIEYEKSFSHEEELKKKLVRLYELNAQLNLENGRIEDVDPSASQKGIQESNVAEKESE